MTPNDLAQALSKRKDDVTLIRYINPCPEGWQPVQSACHCNAGKWVKHHPTWSVVRGWLHESGDPGVDAAYVAHSVVRDEQGQLWDVTLHKPIHEFLEHLGPETEYCCNVKNGSWVRVTEGDCDPDFISEPDLE